MKPALKSISIVITYLLCLVFCPLFGFEDEGVELDYEEDELEHEQCGTEADPNYLKAINALEKAIGTLVNYGDSFGFPEAGNDVCDAGGQPYFYKEGFLTWEVDTNRQDEFVCERILETADRIDIPVSIVSEDDDIPPIYPPEPTSVTDKQTFNLSEDYSALFSVFHFLQEDASFLYENSKEFLFRRMKDKGLYYDEDFFARPLTQKDYTKFLQYQTQQFQRRSKRIEEWEEKARSFCKESLDFCIAYHDSPLAHYQRGIFDYWEGDLLNAYHQIKTALKQAKKTELKKLRESALLLKGRVELEAGLYADAVLTLSDLIKKYPNNKEAYFERATAYFELDKMDLSLEDYLASGIKPEPISPSNTEMVDFSIGLAKGIVQESIQAGAEFIPSVLSSAQGIGHGLWAFAQDPVEGTLAVVQACHACINFIRTHTLPEAIFELAPELKELIATWDELDNRKRGEITGNIIGKYGIDIFAGAGITKIMKSYRQLKRANNLLTFEAMSISERNRSLIKLEAARRAQARAEVLKTANLRIQVDKQGKHIVGHRNYVPLDRPSILEHPNPQKLVDEFAGKGIRIGNFPPGSPGYQEIVNFGEFIGYEVDQQTGKKIATTWGKIHYAKDGVHIVPTAPR